MSRLAAQDKPKIFVSKDNQDIYDTLNPILGNYGTSPALPYKEGMVTDCVASRLNAAFACIYQLKETINRLERRVRELEQ